MIPSNFSPLKISSKIFLRIYNNFSTYIYISPYFRLPYDPFTSLPSLRFLNIDRISLTNIRVARSGGDFLAKSRYTHIYIYICTYMIYTLFHVWWQERRRNRRRRPRVNNAEIRKKMRGLHQPETEQDIPWMGGDSAERDSGHARSGSA